MKKAISLLLALVMLCSLLVACGNGKTTEQPAASAAGETKAEEKPAGDAAAQKTTITVLRPGDQDKVASFMEPAVEAFEKENPDIHVEIMYESWPGWIQTYPTYFEADTQPDVIFWWDNKLHDSSANSHLVNLAPYLSDELTKKIPEGVWNLVDPGDMDGLYYIPSSVDTFVLYYNKDVFKEAGLDPDAPPTNWDELLNAAKTIKEKTGNGNKLFSYVKRDYYIRNYVGVFPTVKNPDGDGELDFQIQTKKEVPHAVNLVCINSPGLTSALPIARRVVQKVMEQEALTPDPEFNPIRKGIVRFAEKSKEEQAALIAQDPDYGEIFCRCECVTKAEIKQAAHNILGVSTVSGMKYRTRATMGRCQGGYCETRVTALLEEELGKEKTEILLNKKGAYMFVGDVK